VLVVLVKGQGALFVDELLHRILDELVERLELLSDKTLVFKEGRDDDPSILLGNRVIVVIWMLSSWLVERRVGGEGKGRR
jgi:hypothetical protein